ncbi:MAG: hypothetical protein AAGA11_07370 [Pseudomonadota bacterium]
MNSTLAAVKRLAIATGTVVAAFGVSPHAHALALGNISVLSGLNQPLRAVVPLLFEDGENAELLELDIAGDADAIKLGALPNLLGQEVDVVMSLQGDRIEALITTEYPVKEPHLDVVLRAEIGGTRHMRVYPVLLDLPSGFFEIESVDDYKITEFSDGTIWNGKPSDRQREQMNEPAELASLQVGGTESLPIAVGGLPPTGYDDPYEETVSLASGDDVEAVRAHQLKRVETDATAYAADAENVGTVLPEASTLATAEVSDNLGARLPTAGIDEAMESLAPDTADTRLAALDIDEPDLAPRQDPAADPNLKSWTLSSQAATPDTGVSPQLDLANWSSRKAVLPLPEAVLLAEVPDDIGAAVDQPAPTVDALYSSRWDRPYD